MISVDSFPQVFLIFRPIDAPTAGAMTDHMLRYLKKIQESAYALPPEEQSVAKTLAQPQKLRWTLSPSIRAVQEKYVKKIASTTVYHC